METDYVGRSTVWKKSLITRVGSNDTVARLTGTFITPSAFHKTEQDSTLSRHRLPSKKEKRLASTIKVSKKY